MKTVKKILSILLTAGVMIGQFGMNALTAYAATVNSVTVTVVSAADVTVAGAGNLQTMGAQQLASGDYEIEINAIGGDEFGPTVSYTVTGFTVKNMIRDSANAIRFIGTLGGSSSSGGAASSGAGASAGGSSEPQYTDAQRAYAAYHDHAHNGNFEAFVWKEASQASDYNNGEEVYCCPDCGYVLYRVPISAYACFNRSLVNKIVKSPAGSTVTIEAGQWISFHKMVIDAMASHPDRTYIIKYAIKGTGYSLTLPAGTDYSHVLGEGENFSGFLNLAVKTGITPEVR